MRMNGMAALATGVCMVALATPAQAQERSFNIPAGNLRSALDAFGRQSGKPIIYKVDEIRGLRTNGYRGSAEPQVALDAILAGTGFTARVAASGAVAIMKAGNVASGSSGSGEAEAGSAAADNAGAGDIVVTAQKREERLLDVAAPLSVLQGAALTESGQTRIQDYFSKVPGLGLALTGDTGVPTPSIRGIATGGNTGPVTAIVVDDIPYGATQGGGFSVSAPDIDPGDIDRIEVLRGPQGTLYGAAGIGGLLKFVTVSPNIDQISGKAEAGLASVRFGSDPSYFARAAVNFPVSSQVAVRGSAFYVKDGGYIDNVRNGARDVNSRSSKGGRLQFLWKPSTDFSLKLGAYVQKSRRDGLSDVDLSLANLTQDTTPGTGIYDREARIFDATLKVNLGGATITSISSYSLDRLYSLYDSPFLAPFLAFPGVNVPGNAVVQPLTRRVEKFSQEIRAEVPVTESINWLTGVFYTQEDIGFAYKYYAADRNTGKLGALVLDRASPATYREYALFSTLAVKLSDRFDIEAGGRVANNRQTISISDTGLFAPLFFGIDPHLLAQRTSSETAFTFNIAPRFKITPNFMIYALAASGYRPGGPNTICGIGGVPCEYGSDKTTNYEIGAKGKAFDNKLTFDLSVYYINWNKIQLTSTVFVPTFINYVANAGKARSQGAEISLELRPWAGMKVSGWVSYNDAEITQSVATGSLTVTKGDRLPYTSPWSGNISLDQKFVLNSDLSANIGGSVDFVGNRIGLISGSAVRPVYADYQQFELHAGLQYQSWSLKIYANNVTDTRGVLRSGAEAARPNEVTFIQPRTIGLSISRAF